MTQNRWIQKKRISFPNNSSHGMKQYLNKLRRYMLKKLWVVLALYISLYYILLLLILQINIQDVNIVCMYINKLLYHHLLRMEEAIYITIQIWYLTQHMLSFNHPFMCVHAVEENGHDLLHSHSCKIQ